MIGKISYTNIEWNGIAGKNDIFASNLDHRIPRNWFHMQSVDPSCHAFERKDLFVVKTYPAIFEFYARGNSKTIYRFAYSSANFSHFVLIKSNNRILYFKRGIV